VWPGFKYTEKGGKTALLMGEQTPCFQFQERATIIGEKARLQAKGEGGTHRARKGVGCPKREREKRVAVKKYRHTTQKKKRIDPNQYTNHHSKGFGEKGKAERNCAKGFVEAGWGGGGKDVESKQQLGEPIIAEISELRREARGTVRSSEKHPS